ncbi:MAG: hypothetical protein SH850_13665 [Planctomycetaceae bacterium]|nr:hypothetical protein [Planctomycetaceae bacterium]
MRSLKCLAVLTVMTSLWGCSTNAPPAVTSAPAVLNVPPTDSSKNTPFTEEDTPDFDPKLTLEWPGTPFESRRRINAGMADETTIYSATFFQTETGTLTIFGASVYQLTEKDLQGSDPKEMLASHGTRSGDEIELTRQQIEHGPKRLLGFDMTAKEDGGFRRRVNILAGTRIYSVHVVSGQKEQLDAEDVTKFFESFAIQTECRRLQ